MARFPQPRSSHSSARPNGFRNRLVLHAGSHTGALPAGATRTASGLILVKAVIIGGGKGGNTDNPSGGKGADYVEKLWEVRPNAAFSATIGAAGDNNGGLGGTSTLTLDGVTLTALGGGQTGASSGGDKIHVGGAGANAGGAAGSPWGPGRAAVGTVPGCWLQPQFWDLDDALTQGLMTPGVVTGDVATWHSSGSGSTVDDEADTYTETHGQGSTPQNMEAFAPIWGIGNGGGPSRAPGFGGGGGDQTATGSSGGLPAWPGIGFLYF